MRVWKGGGSWSRIHAPISGDSRIPHFFHHYPESRSSFPEKYIKKSNFYKSWLILLGRYNVYLARDDFPEFPTDRPKKSRIPSPIFRESRFLGSSQIPGPVKVFIVFAIPAPYFGQIPDPRIPFQTLEKS